MTDITGFAITFGVQYSRKEDAVKHPLGMYGDGYAVIEAPSLGVARVMSFAIFDDRWAFIYPLEEFLANSRRELWHPAGELLRIAWQAPARRKLEELGEAVEQILQGSSWSAETFERIMREAAERGMMFEEATEPFVWDGWGSIQILAQHSHVHSPEGVCLKNRYGRECQTAALGEAS